MKQTAVEFLVEKIENLYYVNFKKSFLEEIEQAKKLEKEQLKECWKKAQEEQRKEFSSSYVSKKFDIYEQFKSENDDKGV